jgi:uncharacterized protein
MRAGMDERTGKLLTGWEHCQQGIRRTLTTRRASLVLRRRIGSGLLDLQDENMSPENVLRAYIAVAQALAPANATWGEPGFRLRSIELAGLNGSGQLALLIGGDYYPNGHLGDYSLVEKATAAIPVREVA